MKKLVLLFVILVIFNSYTKSQEEVFKPKTDTVLVLVSGIETGSYYQIAQDLIKYSGIKIILKPSLGAINNYSLLLNDPEVNIGMVQYDVLLKGKQYDYEKNTKFSENLKVLLPLGYEEIHLITRVSSNILSLQDLAGKKVSVGVPSKEGTSITAGLIKSITEIPWEEVNMSFDSAFVALLKGQIDAMFFVGYAPVQKLKDLLPTYDQLISLVPITDERLSQFHKKSVIHAGTYPWLKSDVSTFAVKSYLVTNIKTDNPFTIEIYQKFLKNIKKNIQIFIEKGHPAWQEVDFLFKDVKWDIHPAAKKVFNLK